MATGAVKDVHASSMVARRVKDKQLSIDTGTQEVTVLFTAFRENRPGGTSLDVFWSTKPTPSNGERAQVVATAAGICDAEGYANRGWACFEVADVLEKVKCVTQVVHSPTQTNALHAHLVPDDWIELQEVDLGADVVEREKIKKANNRKAEVMAKALYDFHKASGTFVPRPATQQMAPLGPHVSESK